jgi:hypothetical protein
MRTCARPTPRARVMTSSDPVCSSDLPRTDHGPSARSYSATKVYELENTKTGTRRADVFPDDENSAKGKSHPTSSTNPRGTDTMLSTTPASSVMPPNVADSPLRARSRRANAIAKPPSSQEDHATASPTRRGELEPETRSCSAHARCSGLHCGPWVATPTSTLGS